VLIYPHDYELAIFLTTNQRSSSTQSSAIHPRPLYAVHKGCQ